MTTWRPVDLDAVYASFLVDVLVFASHQPIVLEKDEDGNGVMWVPDNPWLDSETIDHEAVVDLGDRLKTTDRGETWTATPEGAAWAQEEIAKRAHRKDTWLWKTP